MIRVLLVENNSADAKRATEMLRETENGQIEVTHVERLSSALHRLTRESFDAILLDRILVDTHGLDTLDLIQAALGRMPIVVLGDKDDEAAERQRLEQHGWRVRHAFAAANGPDAYQNYIQRSRGEFSCAKPSCMKFQNAWISDRTLCYLATGKPAVVQHTGPSSYLPDGEGLFRFSTMDGAVQAFETINQSYEENCRAARKIAEEYFDARKSVETILQTAL